MTAPASTNTVTLTDLYTDAADDLEGRHFVNFVGGPNLWTAVHAAVRDLVTAPLVEGARRKLRIDQVQHWRADQATVVKVLRELAGEPEQLELLRKASAENRITVAEAKMRDALGYGGEDKESLVVMAQCAADKIKRLEAENQKLRDELKRARF